MDDLIKEAFYKVKNDITLLYNQLNFAKENINTLKNSILNWIKSYLFQFQHILPWNQCLQHISQHIIPPLKPQSP